MIFEFQIPPEPASANQCAVHENASVAAAAAARRSDRFAEAAQIAHCVLRLHPNDADAWFELGAAKSALDAREEAREAWLRTLDLAPSNDDARLGLARLAWRDEDLAAAERWLAGVSPERRADREALDLRALFDQTKKPSAAWRFDAGAAHSTLSSGLPDWSEARASLYRRQGATGFGLAVEHARRFDNEDTFIELLATHETASVVWSLALGGTPNADFRPEQSVRLGADHFGATWQIGGAVTHAEYVVGPVDKLDIRASRAFGGLRLQASAVAVHDENDQNKFGYGVGVVWQAASHFAIDASWSDAPESSNGMTADVRAVVLGATVDVSQTLRIRAGAAHELRDAYDRTEISLGLARTF